MNLTEGYIYRKGMSPQTRTVVSTKNKIFAKPSGSSQMLQIGVVASFEPSDSRAVEAIRGIGYGDQIAEIVPNASEPISISVTRSALYLSLLMQTFGYAAGVDGLVRALKHHRWPFDIKQEVVFSEIATQNIGSAAGKIAKSSEDSSLRALITFYEACWMTSYSWSFQSDTSLVQENCEISCSDITDGQSLYSKFSNQQTTGNSPFKASEGGSQRFSS